jgi:hypothetical protein
MTVKLVDGEAVEEERETARTEAVDHKPSSRRYLTPVFLDILGGLIGHFSVRGKDKNMADNLVLVGLLTTPALIFIIVVLYWEL